MILDFAKERRAIKNYNPTKFIAEKDLKYIFEVINTAPTSAGVEHWKVLSFRDKDKKKEIIEGFDLGNRGRFVDSSDALVFYTKKTSWYEMKENPELYEKAKRYMEEVAWTFKKEVKKEDVDNFFYGIKTGDHANNNKNYTEWAKRQAYIASAYAMLAAKEIGINSTPMEGFSIKLDDILREKGYIDESESIALVVLLGYSDGVEFPYFGEKQSRDKVSDKFKVI